jgi:hypothetical protein
MSKVLSKLVRELYIRISGEQNFTLRNHYVKNSFMPALFYLKPSLLTCNFCQSISEVKKCWMLLNLT